MLCLKRQAESCYYCALSSTGATVQQIHSVKPGPNMQSAGSNVMSYFDYKAKFF